MKQFNILFTILFLFTTLGYADVVGTKIQGPALIEGFNAVTSAAGTTTLTKDSQTKQILTGSANQTFVLPSATTIPLSRKFLILNKSSGLLTVQTSGGGALTTITTDAYKEFHLRAAGSAAGTWDVLEPGSGGGGGGVWGTITGTLSDQTDLNTALGLKAPAASPTFTGTIGTPLTASRVLTTDGSGNLSASSVTSTTLGYLDVASSLTSLLSLKAPLASPTFSGTITTPLTASRALVTGSSSELGVSTTTATQIGYLDTLSGNVQTQINGKVALSNYSAKGDTAVAASSGVVGTNPVGANGTTWIADSDTTLGVRYGTPVGTDNYLKANPSFESGASTGWATYADAAGTQPEASGGCTGGSPNTTFAASTSAPILNGSYQGLATLSTGATRQGEGFSYAFSIPTKYSANPGVHQIEFDYAISGGTFVAGTDTDRTTAGDSTFTVWVYDVTNSQLIQPSTYRLYSTTGGKFVANFQNNAASTSYRLCIHKGTSATVSGSNITVKFDDFRLFPAQYAYGTPITDWVSYTPTTSWVSNATITGRWRRVGDSMDVQVHAAVTGTPTSADFVPQIPSGYTIDTAKLAISGSGKALGYAIITDSATRFYTASVSHSGSTPTTSVFIVHSESGNTGITNQGNPIVFASGDAVSAFFTVPITGWSSSTQVSDSYSGRIIDFLGLINSGSHSSTGNWQAAPNFTSLPIDTVAASSTSTNAVTIVKSGRYKISGKADFVSNGTGSRGARITKNGTAINGSAVITPSSSSSFGTAALTNIEADLVAGDLIRLEGFQNSGGSLTWNNGTDAQSFLIVTEVNGSQTISATEVVAASYIVDGGGQSLTSTAVLQFNTKVFDTHNAVTTGSSWKFTAPYSGIYELSYKMMQINNTGSSCQISLRKNGSGIYRSQPAAIVNGPSTVVANQMMQADTVLFSLNAGDYIDTYISSAGASGSVYTATSDSWINIKRIK